MEHLEAVWELRWVLGFIAVVTGASLWADKRAEQ